MILDKGSLHPVPCLFICHMIVKEKAMACFLLPDKCSIWELSATIAQVPPSLDINESFFAQLHIMIVIDIRIDNDNNECFCWMNMVEWSGI